MTRKPAFPALDATSFGARVPVSKYWHCQNQLKSAISASIRPSSGGCLLYKTCPTAARLDNVMERQMRFRLTLAVVAAFIGSSSVPALAQAPALAPTAINRGGAGVAGTGFGTAVGIAPRQVPLAIGRGHIGAGTGGTGGGVGNASGGINDTPRAGTGGIRDTTSWGLSTGGVNGTGRGLSAATGGVNDGSTFGRSTGGISGSSIGAGTGGRGDLNSLGAGTGGIHEGNAPRFQVVQ